MNLKKLFAVAAGTLLTVNALTPMAAFGATTFSAELTSAYAYAYGIGATTQYPIENANIYGAITRAELAKVIANWAEKVLGLTPDTSITPSFSDIASLKNSDLYDAVIRATQMGLMGQGITAFRPYDTVTRAEFGTILSRALWGDKNDGGTPYYAAHLTALKNEGIMTQINDPMMKEIRGYVFIMLQRVDEDFLGNMSGKPEECRNPMVILACIMDEASCPAACKDDNGVNPVDPNAPKSGSLEITVPDYSSSIKSAPSEGTVIFNAVKFSSSESVTIGAIQLERIGLSSRSDIKGVWFEKDGIAVSTKGSVSTDSKVTVNFTKGFTVKSNETLDLVVQLSGAAGSEVAFKFIDVDSTARNASFNAQTTTYRTTTYTVAEVEFSSIPTAWTTATYTLGTQTAYTFGQFSVANYNTNSDDKAILLKSITLRNNGRADIGNLLKNVKVLRDGENVLKSVSMDGRNLILTFNDSIEGGKRATYTISAEIASLERVDDTVQFELRKETDLVAYEKATGFRTSNKYTGTSNIMNEYTIKGGRVQFSNDSSFPKTIEAGSGASDVVLAQGTLILAEPIKLGDSSFDVTAGVIRNLVLEFGGSRYSAKKTTAGTTDTFSFDEIYINSSSSVSVKLIASLEALPAATSAQIQAAGGGATIMGATPGNFDNGEYLNNGEKLEGNTIAGAISIAKLDVKTPQFSLKNNTSTTQRVVTNSTETKTILDGTISSSKGNITLNSIELTVSNTFVTPADATVYFYVYVDGVAVGNAKHATATTPETITITPSGIGAVTDSAKSVKVEANVTTRNGETGTINVAVVAKGTDTNGNEATSSRATAATLSVVPAANVSISNSSSESKVVLEGSNAEIARFTTTVKDGNVTIDQVILNGTFPAALVGEQVTLTVGGETWDGVFTSISQIDFNGKNISLKEGNHTFVFTTNINTDGIIAGLQIRTTNADILEGGSSLATRTLSSDYLFVKGFPTLSRVSTDNNELKIRVNNGSNEALSIALADVLLDATLPNGTDYATLNNQTAATYETTLDPKGGTVDIVLGVTVASTAVKLPQLTYSLEDGGTTYTYTITSTYTNVAPWGDLQLTYKS